MIIVDALFDAGGMYHGDQAQQAAYVGRRTGHRWCHLASTESDDELHAFAEKLGMKRRWFDKDHYDLTPGKRALAVKLGAVEVSRRELMAVTRFDRRGLQRPSWAQEGTMQTVHSAPDQGDVVAQGSFLHRPASQESETI